MSQFKYLGSVLVPDGKLDVELHIRKGRAYGRFSMFKKLNIFLCLPKSSAIGQSYVLPILLFGNETLALSK